ncbi:MAG: hypothetical protein LQ340_005367 [Diploschistes diacapsis]|nr:MAG: hypothetical protein LQ340_005367 [Diploschistes diacapsis]
MAGVGGDGISGAGAGGVDGRTKTVERLESADEVRRCFYRSGDTAWDEKEGEESKEGNMEKVWGVSGYMNRGSGWADAAGAMEGLREVVRGLALKRQVTGGSGGFEWVHEKVERLIFGNVDNAEEKVVLGAGLEGGGEIRADTTILAAGAWSAALMPRELGPRLRAKGQVLGYVKLNREEASVYSGKPVIYDMTTGRFIVSPPPIDEDPKARIEGDNEGAILKVARHGHGYAHKVKVEDPIDGDIHKVFLPPPDFQTLPKEGDDDLRDFLQIVFPSLGSKHWCQTRVCVYTDTPSGDFLIDWIPGYGDSILIASGGSGHGYKFTPVIGERIVAKLESKLADENDTSGLGKMLEQLWRWRSDEEVEKGWHGAGDGSRGGPKGMMWEEEIAKR